MRIEIMCNANSNSSLSFLSTNLATLISKSDTTISSLQSIKKFSYSINGGVGVLQGALDLIEAKSTYEEGRKNNLVETQNKTNKFIEIVRSTDDTVSERVIQNQNKFYSVNKWSKPALLSAQLGVWYTRAKDWINKATKNGLDAFSHAWNIYTETDYNSLSDEERKALCDKYLKMLESGDLSSDDQIKLKSFMDYLSNTGISSSMSNSDKEKIRLFNLLFEKIHTDDSNAINNFFNKSAYKNDGSLKEGITYDDIENIKFIAYNSKEPCHSVFFANIEQCNVATWCNDGSIDGNSTSHYNNLGSVFYNLKNGDGIDNPRGPYNTFFHEVGHFIDDNLANGLDGVPVGNGQTRVTIFTRNTLCNGDFFDVLRSDVENHVRNYVESYNDETWLKIDDKGKEKIVSALMDRRNAFTLNPRLKIAYSKIYAAYTGKYGMGGYFDIEANAVIDTRKGLLDGANNELISDIFGGVTNNSIIGTYGHEGNYGGDYWYDKNGNPSGMQNMEFFAEYFAYEMTNDIDAENARKYFKQAYSIMDEAMKQEASKIKLSV